MTSSQLECFLKVAAHLSFRKAAEDLYITQSGVSHQIKALEKEIGFDLFDRTGNRVVLTPAGACFFEGIKRASSIVNRALVESRHVACPSARRTFVLGGRLLPEEMSRIIRAHGGNKSSYDVGFTRDCPGTLLDELLDGRADVVMAMKEDLPADTPCVFLPIKTLRDYCVVGRPHFLFSRDSISVNDLRGQVICQRDITRFSRAFRSVIARIESGAPDAIVELHDDEDYVRARVLAGAAVCMEPFAPHALSPSEDIRHIWLEDGGTYELGIGYLAECTNPDLIQFAHLAQLALMEPGQQ